MLLTYRSDLFIMRNYILILFFGLIMLASCNKEVDVEPANLKGTWAYYYADNNYFEAMRFHDDGKFQYMEKYGYEKVYKDRNEGEDFTFSYLLEDKTITIRRHNPSQTEPVIVRTFRIKKLTRARLAEEDGFQWRKED